MFCLRLACIWCNLHCCSQQLITPFHRSTIFSFQHPGGRSYSGVAETSQYTGNWKSVVPVKAIRLTETSEAIRPTTLRNTPEEPNPQLCTTTRNKSRRNLQSLKTQTTPARFERGPHMPGSQPHGTSSLNFNTHISQLTLGPVQQLVTSSAYRVYRRPWSFPSSVLQEAASEGGSFRPPNASFHHFYFPCRWEAPICLFMEDRLMGIG